MRVTGRTVGGRLFAAVADSSVEIDLTRSAPATRRTPLPRTAPHGPASALALGDDAGRCVALITRFGQGPGRS